MLTGMLALALAVAGPWPAPAALARADGSGAVRGGTRDGRVTAGARPPLMWLVWPSTGPVVEGFDEPAGRFDPGHRGVDIAVPPGTPVHAAADGTVLFAGVVAGSRYVTLAHPATAGSGRLETTYSFLSRIDVRAGDAVHAGDVVGASGPGHPGSTVASLHFGVRRDGRYVDPAPLLGFVSGAPDDVSDLVSLGPLPLRRTTPPRPEPPTERIGVRLSPREGGHETAQPRDGEQQVTARTASKPMRAVDRDRPSGEIPPAASAPSPGAGATRSVRQQCGEETGAARPALPTPAQLEAGARPPAPPDDNVVVAIAGIGSSTWRRPGGSVASDAAMYGLDLRTLGYPADRIHHFSYRGIPAPEQSGQPGQPGQPSQPSQPSQPRQLGQPGQPSGPAQPSGSAPYRLHLPYDRRDTFQPITRSAALLRQLLERIHAEDPARHVDLVAHSQGGVVAQYYLEQLYDPAQPGSPVVDHLVTIASPHRGADLAGLSARLGTVGATEPVRQRMDRLAAVLGAPPPGSPAAADLAPGSPTMIALSSRWAGSTGASAVRTTTIAAGLDLVVPAQRTKLPGALHYTVDVSGAGPSLWAAHTAVVAAEATRRIAYGALSDHPAPCTTLEDLMAGSIAGPLVAALQSSLLDTLANAAAPATPASVAGASRRR